MTARYNSESANSHIYLDPVDIRGGGRDSTSGQSSAGLPQGSFVRPLEHLDLRARTLIPQQVYKTMYGKSINGFIQHSYPVQDRVSAAAIGLIPVVSDIEGFYEIPDSRQKKNGNEKVTPSRVDSVRNRDRPNIGEG
jgi:hypothetical protein